MAPFLLTARLDGLEQLREKGLTVERDASAGAAPHVWDESAGDLCEGACRFVHAVCVLASGRSRKCHCGFLWRFVGFVTFVIYVMPACRVPTC